MLSHPPASHLLLLTTKSYHQHFIRQQILNITAQAISLNLLGQATLSYKTGALELANITHSGLPTVARLSTISLLGGKLSLNRVTISLVTGLRGPGSLTTGLLLLRWLHPKPCTCNLLQWDALLQVKHIYLNRVYTQY